VRFRGISWIVPGSIGRATIHSIKAWPIIATFVAVWVSATECLNSALFLIPQTRDLLLQLFGLFLHGG
jgi:hypothetical protein